MTLRALANSLRWLIGNRQGSMTRLAGAGTGRSEPVLVPDPPRPGRRPRARAREVFFTAHRQVIRALLTRKDGAISAGGGYRFLAPYLGPRSILMLDGPTHHAVRRFATAAIRGGFDFDPDKVIETDRQLADLLPSGPVGSMAAARLVTGRIAVQALFPGTPRPKADHLIAQAATMVRSAGHLALNFPQTLAKRLGAQARARAAKADVLRFIRGYLATSGGRALHGGLLAGHGPRVATDTLLTLFITGHVTTASTIAWSLTELAVDRDNQDRLRQEILAAPQDAAGLLSYVRRFDTQLHAEVMAVLRRHPVVPMILRHIRADLDLATDDGPVGLGKDSYAVISIEQYHRRHPDAALLSFGGGAKACPGRDASITEMKLVLALLLRRVRLGPTRKTSTRHDIRSLAAPPRCGGQVCLEPRPASG